MNTTAVVMGAVVVAGAAAAAVWYLKSRQPAPAPVQMALAPAPAAPVPAPATPAGDALSRVVSGIGNAAKTVSSIVNTGKKLFEGVSSFFKGFKL